MYASLRNRISLFALFAILSGMFAAFAAPIAPVAAAPASSPAANGPDDREFTSKSDQVTLDLVGAHAPDAQPSIAAAAAAPEVFLSAEVHYFFRSDKLQPFAAHQNISGTLSLEYVVTAPGYSKSGTVDLTGTGMTPLFDKEVISPALGLEDIVNVKLLKDGKVVLSYDYGLPNGGPVFSHVERINGSCDIRIVGHVDPYAVVTLNGVVIATFFITTDDWVSDPIALPADVQSGMLKVAFYRDETMTKSRGWFEQEITNTCYQAPQYSVNPTSAINCQQQWVMINGETVPAGATFVWSLGNSGTLADGVNEITNVATITFSDLHVETREVKIKRVASCPIDTQYNANPTSTINCKQQWSMVNGETVPAGATFVWSLGNSGTLADGVNEITNVATITFSDLHVETREVKITRSTESCETPDIPKTRVIIATGFQCAGAEGWIVKKETIRVNGRTYLPVETQIKWIGANKDSNLRLNNPPQIGEKPTTDEGKLIVGWDKSVDLVLAATMDTREVKWFRAEEPWYDHNSVYATIRGVLFEAKLVIKYKVNGVEYRDETITQAYAVAIPSAEYLKACEPPTNTTIITKKICKNGVSDVEVPADSTEVDDGSCTPPPPPPVLKDRCAGLDDAGNKIIVTVPADSEDLDSPACTAGDDISSLESPTMNVAPQPNTGTPALILSMYMFFLALLIVRSFSKA